jgi:F0F1-type ATP synthase membrane subunit c/vacuolar-type H+-ATPase subunit K
MSKNESVQEFGESQHPIITKAAALLMVGATALGVGYAANQAYEAVANIANVQPSGEQIYDSIVGPAHE